MQNKKPFWRRPTFWSGLALFIAMFAAMLMAGWIGFITR
jgi:hypothetical protein